MSDIVERLRKRALPDPHDEREVMGADDLREAAAEIERLRAELEAARRDGEKDTKRVGYLHCIIDGYGDFDVHEQACIYASAMGRDEPNGDDYLAADRDMIDAAMKESK